MSERPRILCVDDERDLLEALQDSLRRDFDVTVASSGVDGLEQLAKASFEVVMSDMRMPGMDGATFLSRAREQYPDTVRLLLTGQADIDSAVAAVNGGQLFRFLLKPCSREQLIEALSAASRQHRLITAEKVLLQQTLTGTVEVLTEILSLASPQAFGRATRAKQHVLELAFRLGVADTWPLEVAAMFSQIAYVVLPEATQAKVYEGRPLNPDEEAMVDRLPMTTRRILANIPRLEPVCAILAEVGHRPAAPTPGASPDADLIRFGANALTIALDYDICESADMDPELAVDTLRSRAGRYDPHLLEAFARLIGTSSQRHQVLELRLAQLELGMEFLDDVRSTQGTLLVPRGYKVTPSLLERLRNFPRGSVAEPLRVGVGVGEDAAAAAA
jgi:CheY-like chemotaxis protein